MLKRTDDLIVIVDTREQTPLEFPAEIVTVRGTLNAGDYSVQGLEDLVAVERKELSDLVACVGPERDRFERELLRLRGWHSKAVMVEATLAQLEKGGWRSQVTPAAVLGSIAAWRIKYKVEFIYAGNHELAAGECLRLLRKFRDHCADAVKRFM
jgi:DNA excision repair protein ERCC-4